MQPLPITATRVPARPAPAPDGHEGLSLIGVARTFHRDQSIYCEGDAAEFVYKVVSGAVRRVRLLADGRRQISDFYLPGDVFGLEAGSARRDSAEAMSEAVLIVARRSALAAQADALWRLAAWDLARSYDHVLTLGRRTAAERVATFLIELAGRLGADDQVELPMSRQDMADYLGLTIETVSRTLTQLQADGLIEIPCYRAVRLARREMLADLCE